MPGFTITPAPSQTSSPIVTGRASSRPLPRVLTSSGCVAARIWTPGRDEHALADANRSAVEHDAIEVDERVVADRDMSSVVAMERRLDRDALAELADQLRENSQPVAASSGAESLYALASRRARSRSSNSAGSAGGTGARSAFARVR